MSKKAIIIGLGFVGQANALALIKMGYKVYGYDVKAVKSIYKDKDFSRITFLPKIIKAKFGCPVLVCVNAPTTNPRTLLDLRNVKKALSLGRKITSGPIILRSTVLPTLLKPLDFDFYFPEFLRELTAVRDVLRPELSAIGAKKRFVIPAVIRDLTKNSKKVYFCKPEEAAFIKYLNNVWKSLKVAFVNEVGDIIKNEKLNPGKILNFVFERKPYLKYGREFGGHCLPKDSKAFAMAFRKQNTNIAKALIVSNQLHSTTKKLRKWYN